MTVLAMTELGDICLFPTPTNHSPTRSAPIIQATWIHTTQTPCRFLEHTPSAALFCEATGDFAAWSRSPDDHESPCVFCVSD